MGSGDFTQQRRADSDRAAVPVAVPVADEEAAFEPAPQRALESNPYETTSRLNGLRGMLFSLGLKNLSKARESGKVDEESLLPLDEEREHTVLAQKFTPFAEPVPVVASSAKSSAPTAPARPVVAEPEFLPPKEFIPIKDREEARENGSKTRMDSESADDVRILPSRRGQYKRRG
jgi:hypothetical protein